jgi:hypothetical protein
MAHKLGGVHAGVPLRINATAPVRREILSCPMRSTLAKIGAVIVRGEVYTSVKEGSMGVCW